MEPTHHRPAELLRRRGAWPEVPVCLHQQGGVCEALLGHGAVNRCDPERQSGQGSSRGLAHHRALAAPGLLLPQIPEKEEEAPLKVNLANH